jgi:hypothetical protein
MEDYALAHAYQVYPFLTVILTIIDPFYREAIAERFDSIMERDAMAAPIGGSLRLTPPKLVIPHMY